MTVSVRNGKLSDWEEIHRILNMTQELQTGIEYGSYTEKWAKSMLKNRKQYLSLILEDGSKIVGFIIGEIWRDREFSYITDLYIDVNYRRRGFAKKLKLHFEKECKKIGLKSIFSLVGVRNKKMQELNHKLKYKKGEAFYLYQKELK